MAVAVICYSVMGLSKEKMIVNPLLLQLIGGSVCQYMNFVQRMSLS